MLSLLQAIKNEFTSSTELMELFPNSYDIDLQPSGGDEPPVPACRLSIMPSPKPVLSTQSKDGSFPYTEDVHIQFSVFAPNIATIDEYGVITDGFSFCINAAEALDGVFYMTRYWDIGDEYSPDAIICSERTNVPRPYRVDENEWQIDVMYTVKVQRYTGSI